MDYVQNNYRKRSIGNKVFLTTDYGTWILLSKDEYYDFRLKKDNPKLFKKLEEKRIILTENNKENIINLLRKKKIFLFKGATLHIVVPTLRCNLKCVYCHASSKPLNASGYDMDIETAKKTVDFIWNSPAPDIVIEFQGGEPLLNFEVIKSFINYAKEKNKKIKKKVIYTIVTNLLLLNDEIINFIKENNIRICTSIDGPAFVHEKNRGKHFNEILKRISRLRKYHLHINALMVATKNSLPYWKEIINEYLRLGFNQIWIKPINKLGFSKENWNNIGYSVKEYLDFWKKSVDYIIKLNEQGVMIREVGTAILTKKLIEEEDPMFTDLQSPCGGAITQIAYNYDGKIYTCDEARMIADKTNLFKIGNVKTDTYNDVISSNSTKSFISCSSNDNIVICSKCVWKPFCGICPVVNFEDEGRLFCNRKNFRCEMLDSQFEFILKKLMSKDAKILKRWISFKR